MNETGSKGEVQRLAMFVQQVFKEIMVTKKVWNFSENEGVIKG